MQPPQGQWGTYVVALEYQTSPYRCGVQVATRASTVFGKVPCYDVVQTIQNNKNCIQLHVFDPCVHANNFVDNYLRILFHTHGGSSGFVSPELVHRVAAAIVRMWYKQRRRSIPWFLK